MKIKYITNILFLIVSVFAIQTANSQEIKVDAKLDSIVMELGDQIWLNLKVEQSKKDVVEFPELLDTIIDGIEIIEIAKIDSQIVNGGLVTIQKVLITSFEDSVFEIPPFLFKHGNDSLFTKTLVLSVSSILLDSTELAKIDTTQLFKVFDVKEPIETPVTFNEIIQRYYVYILIGLGIIILLVILILFVLKKKKEQPIIIKPEKPKEPAHLIAFRALDLLKSKKLWQSGKEKTYYSELTEIMKEYIENRYNLSTFERTSQEILVSIKNKNIMESDLYEKLENTFSIADLTKFAKYMPLPDENDLCFKNIYEIVNLTKLVSQVKSTDDLIKVNTDK